MKKYVFDVVPVDDGSEDLAIQLSDEFCKDEDWQTNDIIEWIDLKDGSYQLVNKTRETRK